MLTTSAPTKLETHLQLWQIFDTTSIEVISLPLCQRAALFESALQENYEPQFPIDENLRLHVQSIQTATHYPVDICTVLECTEEELRAIPQHIRIEIFLSLRKSGYNCTFPIFDDEPDQIAVEEDPQQNEIFQLEDQDAEPSESKVFVESRLSVLAQTLRTLQPKIQLEKPANLNAFLNNIFSWSAKFPESLSQISIYEKDERYYEMLNQLNLLFQGLSCIQKKQLYTLSEKSDPTLVANGIQSWQRFTATETGVLPETITFLTKHIANNPYQQLSLEDRKDLKKLHISRGYTSAESEFIFREWGGGTQSDVVIDRIQWTPAYGSQAYSIEFIQKFIPSKETLLIQTVLIDHNAKGDEPKRRIIDDQILRMINPDPFISARKNLFNERI